MSEDINTKDGFIYAVTIEYDGQTENILANFNLKKKSSAFRQGLVGKIYKIKQ
jgi:hypothetical protein